MANLVPTESGGAFDLDLSGRELQGYHLLRRLGRGAMAEVYLAEQQSLRRQVAFKVLKRELAGDDNYVRRFHMEAQSAAALVHANIVQIHEVGCADGIHFIAQEYVAGQNLRELLTRRGLPEIALVVAVMRQVAAALAKAADQGIVHRDIKPENIMLTRTGEVKVADFGLARVMGDGDGLNLTQTGMTMGTPLYMSPEQVEGRPVDSRSDIYSLGVTAYQMLSGQPPFRGETALSVALQHVKTQPDRLENRRPDLPPGLCRIVHKMLAKDPADRYANPRDLLRDLRSLEIEGASGDWPAELDERNTTELAALGQSTLPATRRLETVMKTQALVIRDSRRWLVRALAVVAGAFVVGGLAGVLLREPFLLNVPAAQREQDAIKDKGGAQEQFLFAVQADSEAAWKSVAQYYPDDKVYVPRAKQQLARLYLEHDRYDDALKLFQEFAAYGELERSYRAFGLAGECVVYAFQGNKKESAKSASELKKLAGGFEPAKLEPLLDRKMVQTFGLVLRKDLLTTDKQVDRQTAGEWDKWLDSHFHDEPATPTGN